jgi:hypothetical protein
MRELVLRSGTQGVTSMTSFRRKIAHLFVSRSTKGNPGMKGKISTELGEVLSDAKATEELGKVLTGETRTNSIQSSDGTRYRIEFIPAGTVGATMKRRNGKGNGRLIRNKK